MTSLVDISLTDTLAQTHLICDASYPLITSTTLREEAILYNLDEEAISNLSSDFQTLTEKQISADYDINDLSGGQKVILMILLALVSQAQNIVFLNLQSSLDTIRYSEIIKLIDFARTVKHEILIR